MADSGDCGTISSSAVASTATAAMFRNYNPTLGANPSKSCEEDELCSAEDAGATQVLVTTDSRRWPWLNGVELLEDTNRNKHFLPTGCKGIDVLLGGGLRQGQLIEIVGPSSSGKTQVCLYTASHVADKQLGAVVFFDTCNSFSPKRIACIVGQPSVSLVKEAKEQRHRRIMSSILCHSVFDIFALLDVLHQLEFSFKRQVNNGDTKICLLIIDSISSLITPILGGKGSQGRSLMVSVGIALKRLANEHNLSVLVTNHMVSGEGGISKPALGESWKSIPHARLLISRGQESNAYNVSVLKHTIVACGRTAQFVIQN